MTYTAQVNRSFTKNTKNPSGGVGDLPASAVTWGTQQSRVCVLTRREWRWVAGPMKSFISQPAHLEPVHGSQIKCQNPFFPGRLKPAEA